MQTFEIFIPQNLLQQYKHRYLVDVETNIQKMNNENAATANAVQKAMTNPPAIPTGLDLDSLDSQKKNMNKIMMKYVEQVRAEPNVYIKERSWLERLINRAPKAALINDRPIMYKDKFCKFGNTFLMGMDFDFLMLDVCTVSFIEIASRHDSNLQSRVLMGVLMAYILDSMLIWMRGYFGRRNLSKHTLVDESFLI